MWIARCLRAGFISPSNIELGKATEIKELCRLRNSIVEEITRKKNCIHKILDEYQRKPSTFSSSLNTHLALHAVTVLAQGGTIEDLKENCHTTRLKNSVMKKQKSLKIFLSPPLPSEARLTLELALRGLLERAQACSKIDSQLAQKLKEPSIQESLGILSSISGISGVSALHLLFEIGRIDRFPSKRQIVSWAGLCPRIYSSGGITSRGHITKRGNVHVRRILFQAARASLRNIQKTLWQEIDRLEQEIEQLSSELHWGHKIEQLTSIPGIGKQSAITLYAEIGEVIKFPTPRNLVAWSGLAPSVYQSASKYYNGRITKQGNRHIRYILFNCVLPSLRRKNTELYQFYQRLRKTKPFNVVRTAIMAKILRIIHHLLRHGDTFIACPTRKRIRLRDVSA